MRRKDREVTEKEKMESILEKATVCRLALCDGDVPYIVPLNFGYRGGQLYFHSAAEGRKLDILRANNRVCFEVDVDTEVVAGSIPCRFGMRYASVIGFGRAFFLTDPAEKRNGLEILFRHYGTMPFEEISEETLQRVVVFRVEIESMTGKVSTYTASPA